MNTESHCLDKDTTRLSYKRPAPHVCIQTRLLHLDLCRLARSKVADKDKSKFLTRMPYETNIHYLTCQHISLENCVRDKSPAFSCPCAPARGCFCRLEIEEEGRCDGKDSDCNGVVDKEEEERVGSRWDWERSGEKEGSA